MGATKEYQIDSKEVRKRLGMNQQEFWGHIGVAQSAGSRYESGRRMPKSVQELLRVVHLERIDLSRVSARDMAILDYLKVRKPGHYRRLSEAVASALPQSTVTHIRPIQPVPKPERRAIGMAGGGFPDMEFLTGWVNRRRELSGIEASSEEGSVQVCEPVQAAAPRSSAPA